MVFSFLPQTLCGIIWPCSSADCTCIIIILKGLRYNNLFFSLEGWFSNVFQSAWLLKTLLWDSGFLNLLGAYVFIWSSCLLLRYSKTLSTFCKSSWLTCHHGYCKSMWCSGKSPEYPSLLGLYYDRDPEVLTELTRPWGKTIIYTIIHPMGI